MTIEVRPSASGVATIYNMEIVLYIASLMAAKLEAGDEVEQDFVFTAHDLFSVTSSNHRRARMDGCRRRGSGFRARRSATNIEAGGESEGEGDDGFFS